MFVKAVHAVAARVPDTVIDVGWWVYWRLYVPMFAAGERVYDLGGYEMYLDPSESTMMAGRRFRNFEPHVSELLSERLDEGDIYVGVGANKGYHALDAARRVGPEGSVHCFEPDPQNAADLRRNVELNGFENVIVHERAVHESTGTVAFDDAGRSGHGRVAADGDGVLEVEVTTFDDFVREADFAPADVDFVKVDVEGGEVPVIEGMRGFLSESSDCTLVVEVHSDEYYPPIREVLRDTGCTFETLVDEYLEVVM